MDTDGYFSFLDNAWGGASEPAASRPTATSSSRRLQGETTLTGPTSVNPPCNPISVAEPPPKPAGDDASSLTSSPLSLAYTLVIGAGLMVAFLVIHLLVNLMYKRLVDGDLPVTLALPSLETQLLCLILMAVTFPAFLCLGSKSLADASLVGSKPAHGFVQSDGLAIFVLAALVVPFAGFLWWITLARIILGLPLPAGPSPAGTRPEETPPPLIMLLGLSTSADDLPSGDLTTTPLYESHSSSECYDLTGDNVSSSTQLTYHNPGGGMMGFVLDLAKSMHPN